MLSFGENDPAQLALWEMSHRFFNSLQVIDSLLAGAIREMGPDDAAVWGMQGIRGRVRAIAHLQRRMTQPPLFGALLEGHCREICIDLVRCFGREDVTPWVEMAEVGLEPDREERLLLLIVELVTNALKYSRTDGCGTVWIDLKQAGADQLELRVRDNGQACVPSERSPRPRIAEALARSLGGELRVSTDHGFNVQVRFPLTAPAPCAQST